MSDSGKQYGDCRHGNDPKFCVNCLCALESQDERKLKLSDNLKILALDPATSCGWAHSAGPRGTWDLSIRRDESAGMRLIRLRGKLEEMRASVGVDLVVFEAARHAAPKMQGALVVQAELQSVIKLWCEDHGIPYRGYSPAEVKKHATGKGNASKGLVMDAAARRWGAVSDDNEADALWLLDLARRDVCSAGPARNTDSARSASAHPGSAPDSRGIGPSPPAPSPQAPS